MGSISWVQPLLAPFCTEMDNNGGGSAFKHLRFAVKKQGASMDKQ